MKQRKFFRRTLCGGLALALMAGLFLAGAAAIPAKTAAKSGVTVYQNAKATVDASNLAEGFLTVTYTGKKTGKVKAQITKTDGITYTYNIGARAATLPLTEGDGEYTVKIFEQTSGTRYAQAYACTLTLNLRDEFLPFLYPNQYVNFTSKSATAQKAAALTKGMTDDLDKVAAIYHFVVKNITYDHQRAKTVQSGYLPDVDAVLKEGKGICFDYAALMAAMLRSQNIPCKLVVGNAGKIYHAWVSVYTPATGWIDKAVYFDGTAWSLMDPTFVSGGKSGKDIMKYVTDDTNYTQVYAY